MRRRGPLLSTALLTAATLIAAPVLTPTAAVAQAPGHAAQAASSLVTFAASLDALGSVEALGQPLPMVRRSPRELLGLGRVFGDTLGASLRKVPAGATASDLATALKAGARTAGDDGVAVAVEAVTVTEGSGGVLDIAFTTTARGSRTLPVDHVETRLVSQEGAEDQEKVLLAVVGDAAVPSTSVPVSTSLSGSFRLRYDPARPLAQQLHLTAAPVLALRSRAADTTVSVPAVYGVADVSVDGSIAFDLQRELRYVDPDADGVITQLEWSTVLPSELAPLVWVDAEGPDVAVDLTLARKVLPGDTAAGGTLRWSVASSAADAAASRPTLTVSSDLAPFAEVTAEQLLSGLGLFATSLQAAGATADAAVPLTSGKVSDAYAPAAALDGLVKRQSDAQIVCGKTNTSPPREPTLPGDTWYCQAFTADDAAPGSVSWSTDRGRLQDETKDGTVARTPTRNVVVSGTATPPQVSVTWKDVAQGTAPGATRTAERRVETVGRLQKAVQTALFGTATPPAGQGVTLSYDAATRSLVLRLRQDSDPAATKVRLSPGDLLRPVAHVNGLTPRAGADGDVVLDADAAKLDVGFGVSLVAPAGVAGLDPLHADDPQSDRYFAVVGTDAELSLGSVTATPKTGFVLDGAVGYLGVTATGVRYALAKKDSAAPALRVDLTPDAAGKNGTGVTGSLLLRRVLGAVVNDGNGKAVMTTDEGADLFVTGTRNLSFSGSLDVEARGALKGLSDGAHRVDLSWSALGPDARPVVTVADGYRKALLPFDVRPQVTGVVTGAEPSLTLTDSSAEFTRAFGFLVAQGDAAVVDLTLHNRTTGATCTGLKVTSATQLVCAGDAAPGSGLTGMSGGMATNPDGSFVLDAGVPRALNTWRAGDRYEVVGDERALGVLLLEAYADLAGRMATLEGKGFDVPLPVVGLTPAQLAPQFAATAAGMSALRTRLQTTSRGDAEAQKVDGPPQTLQDLVVAMGKAATGTVTVKRADLETDAVADATVPHLVLQLGPLTRSGTGDLDGDGTSEVALRLPVGPDGLPLVGSDTAVADLPVTWSSTAQLDLAVPLDLRIDPNDVTVLSSTGLSELKVSADGTAVDVTGSYGGVGLEIGRKAVLTGTHQDARGTQTGPAAASGTATGPLAPAPAAGASPVPAPPATGTQLVDSLARFSAELVGQRLVRPASGATAAAGCTVTAVASSSSLTCSGLSDGSAWTAGTPYRISSPLVLVDASADFVALGVTAGAVLSNTTDAATCTVASVARNALTCAAPLAGAPLAAWDVGDGWSAAAGTGLRSAGAGFDRLGIQTGADTVRNTTRGTSCVVTTVTADVLLCAEAPVTWKAGDAFELGGASTAKMSAAYDLLSPGQARLDPPQGEAGFLSTLEGEVKAGTSTARCAAGSEGVACARLSVRAPAEGAEPATYLGTVSTVLTAGSASPTATVPPALTAGQQGGEPLDLGLLDLGLPFLPTLVDKRLDGGDSGRSVGLVGTDLAAGARVGQGLQEVASALSGVGDGITGANAGALQAAVAKRISDSLVDAEGIQRLGAPQVTLLCQGGTPCAASAGIGTVSDVRVRVPVGSNLATGKSSPRKGCADCGAARVAVPFDLGVPGLQVTSSAELTSRVGWSAALDFGVNRKDGPYLGAGGTTDVTVGAQVQVPDSATCSAPLGAAQDARRAQVPAAAGTATSKPTDYASGRCLDVQLGLLPATLYDGKTTPDRPGATTGSRDELPVSDWADRTGAPRMSDRTRTELLTTLDLKPLGGPADVLSLDALLLDEDASEVTVDAQANLDGWVVTRATLGKTSLPSIAGSLHLYSDTTPLPGQPIIAQLEYRDVYMELGEFWGFFEPVLKDIQAKVKPIAPFIDSLTTPLPVVSDVSEKTGNGQVTVYDMLSVALARARSKATTQAGRDKADMVRTFLTLMKTIQGVSALKADSPGPMGLGSPTSGQDSSTGTAGIRGSGGFKVDTEGMGGPCGASNGAAAGDTRNKLSSACKRTTTRAVSGAFSAPRVFGQSGNNVSKTERIKPLTDCGDRCTGKELSRTVTKETSKGLTGTGLPKMPFLSNANEIYGMMLGAHADLVHMDFGVLHADVALGLSYGPIMMGPVPVEIEIGLAFTVDARIVMGFDTGGLAPYGSGDVLEGLYLDDLDNQGKDVPEVRFLTTVSLGASVSVSIFKVGVRGSLTFGLLFDLQDPQPDGKMRFAEFRSLGGDPWCMFKVSGQLTFLLELFVTIDMRFWSKTYSQTLYKYGPKTLFDKACTPPEPVLAERVGADLVLNVGDRATSRKFAEKEVDEAVEVRQVGPLSVTVTAFGVQKPYTLGAKGVVRAKSGSGDDALSFSAGVDASGTAWPFTLPLDVDAGADRDRVEGGGGDDVIKGGDGPDVLLGGAGEDEVEGGPGADSVDGGLGADVLQGGAGDDGVSGGAGTDAVDGGEGNDKVVGGPGLNDVLARQAGAKRFPKDAAAAAALASSLQDGGDLLVGGLGDDDLSGLFGADLLFGDGTPVNTDNGAATQLAGARTVALGEGPKAGETAPPAVCDAGDHGGADRLEGEFGADLLFGGAGPDRLKGGRDADVLCGGGGDDLLEGDLSAAGATGYRDELYGGPADDAVYGYGGDDVLDGGAGADLVAGGDGADRLLGGDGPDQVQGGPGADIALGDTGTVRTDAAYDATARTVSGTSEALEGTSTDRTSSVVCGQVVAVKAGLVDLDGSGTVDSADSGRAAGVTIRSGLLDVERRGAASGGDFEGRLVLAGKLDVSGDGSVTGADDGLVQVATSRPSGAAVQADCLDGGEGGDALLGGAGGDVVEGGDGPDLLLGGAGRDVLRGAGASDTLGGGAEADTAYGDAGDDLLRGGLGDDVLRGGTGKDHLRGEQGEDLLAGDAQDDVLVGGSSGGGDDAGDVLQGGDGSDLLLGDNAATRDGTTFSVHDLARRGADVPASRYGDDALDGGAGADRLYGGGGQDSLTGDAVAGVGGVDWLEGGPGADDLSGGAEADVLLGGSASEGVLDGEVAAGGRLARGDVLRGGAGADLLAGDNATVVAGVVTRLDVLQRGVVGGDAADDAVSGGDVLEGQDGDDLLEGGGGDDTLRGGAGADVLRGGAAGDGLEGDSGDDLLVGGGSHASDLLDADDRLAGGTGRDVLLGDNGALVLGRVMRLDDAVRDDADDDEVSGDDQLNGQEDDDVLHGGGGDDLLKGHAGADVLLGNAGDDDLAGGTGADQLTGGSDQATVLDGDDLLRGGDDADVLLGDDGRAGSGPELFGGALAPAEPDADRAGDDRLYGDGGTDVLAGQDGDDLLSGGDGDDDLQGGTGTDRLAGDGGQDALVGGSSVHVVGGTPVQLRGQRDGADALRGGGGDAAWDQQETGSQADGRDALLGDNGVVTVPAGTAARDPEVLLYDVSIVGKVQPATPTAGADDLDGGGERDLLLGQDGADVLRGGAGEDHLEGGAGADSLAGQGGDDDLVGGSSSGQDGVVQRGSFPAGTSHADGADRLAGGEGDDLVLGDNGRVDRGATHADWRTIRPSSGPLRLRTALVPRAAEADGAYGDDVLDGGDGRDELHGELGADTLAGRAGDDTVVGDLASVVLSVQAGPTRTLNGDRFVTREVGQAGTLTRTVTLLSEGLDHADTVTGGGGDDVVHTGGGADTVWGWGAPAAVATADLDSGLAGCAASSAAACQDRDVLFTGDGDDKAWGGPDRDHVYGGHGRDRLDVITTVEGDKAFDLTGADLLHGGYGADVLQADVSRPNPNDVDKLVDAAGVFNLYLVCEGAYGGNSVLRQPTPGMTAFLTDLATAQGMTGGGSARELGLVTNRDVNANASPAFPGTPGNFTCLE